MSGFVRRLGLKRKGEKKTVVVIFNMDISGTLDFESLGGGFRRQRDVDSRNST